MLKILNIKNLEHEELKSKTTGEKYSLSVGLSSIYEFKDLFIHHEIILPGRKASASHFHTKKEEMIFVLAGNPTIHEGDKIKRLGPGDFIGVKPLSEAYYLENLTDFEVRVLMICSNPDEDVVCYR